MKRSNHVTIIHIDMGCSSSHPLLEIKYASVLPNSEDEAKGYV